MDNVQSPTPQQTPTAEIPPPRSNILPMIFGGLVLLGLGLVGGYFFANSNSSSSQITNQLGKVSPTGIVSSPAPVDTIADITWKSDTIQVRKSTAVSGNETININLQVPSTFNIEKSTDNCPSYTVRNWGSSFEFKLTPICTGWAARYSNWPQDAEVIKEEKNVGSDGRTTYIVRYLNSQTNQYVYVEGEKGTSNKIIDTILIRYGSEAKFLPATITLKLISPQDGQDLNIVNQHLKSADYIVSSVKAQELNANSNLSTEGQNCGINAGAAGNAQCAPGLTCKYATKDEELKGIGTCVK